MNLRQNLSNNTIQIDIQRCLSGRGTDNSTMLSRQSMSVAALDKKIAHGGILVAIALFIISYIYLYNITYMAISLIVLIACVTWLLLRRCGAIQIQLFNGNNIRYAQLGKLLTASFFILQTLAIIVFYLRPEQYQRPLLFFFIIVIMIVIVAFEILIAEDKSKVRILLQILLVGINIVWPQYLLFPGVTGVDPGAHLAIADFIIKNGYVMPDQSYTFLPLFHILTATDSLITGLGYKFAVMSAVGITQMILNISFIYLIARSLTKNIQIGLLAPLFVVFLSFNIQMSVNIIPNTLASIYLPIILYLLIKTRQVEQTKTTVILFLFMFAAILTHAIVALALSLILFAAYFLFQFCDNVRPRNERLISAQIPILFCIAMLSWWTYASGSIATVARFVHGSQTIDTISRISNVNMFEHLLNNMGMLFFLFFALIGVFYMVSNIRDKSMFTYALIALIPLLLAFFPFILGQRFISNRWYFLAQILLSIPLSIAIMYIVQSFNKKGARILFLIVGISLMALFSIMSSVASIDVQFFSNETSERYALTDSELSTFKLADGISESRIYSDRYYYSRMNLLGYDGADIATLVPSSSYIRDAEGMILIRWETIQHPSILGSNQITPSSVEMLLFDSKCAKVIDGSSVDAFLLSR